MALLCASRQIQARLAHQGRIAPQPPGGASIHDRPERIANRADLDHWEADAMLFPTAGQAMIVAHERQSRLTIAVRQTSLEADPAASTLIAILANHIHPENASASKHPSKPS